MDARATLFHQVVTQCNKALSDLNLLRVKTAVLRHDSKLCRSNVEKIQDALALDREDQLKRLVELNQEQLAQILQLKKQNHKSVSKHKEETKQMSDAETLESVATQPSHREKQLEGKVEYLTQKLKEQ